MASTTVACIHDAAGPALVEELSRRIAVMVQAARIAIREAQLHASTVALATTVALVAAAALTEAAQALSTGVAQVLGATGVKVYTRPAPTTRPACICCTSRACPEQLAAAFPAVRLPADLR